MLARSERRRYAAMTCNTADEKIAKAYLISIENIEPLTTTTATSSAAK